MNTHEQLLSPPWIEDLSLPLLTDRSSVLDWYWVDKNWWHLSTQNPTSKARRINKSKTLHSKLSDCEHRGHKAVVYKSHFLPLRHSVVTETPTRYLGNKPRLTKDQALCSLCPHDKSHNQNCDFVGCFCYFKIILKMSSCGPQMAGNALFTIKHYKTKS